MKILQQNTLILIIILWVFLSNIMCSSDAQPKIDAGIDGCSACGMGIDEVNQACGYFIENDFNPFCSTGCLLKTIDRRKKQGEPRPDRIFFADYLGTGLLPAKSVTFLVTEHIPSVMGWGYISFADPDQAREHKKYEDETIVDWIGLRTLKGDPDRTIRIFFTAEGTVPPVTELTRDELVLFELRGPELKQDLTVVIRGYEEIGKITIPSSGDTEWVRLLATKPGAGFAFVEPNTNKIYGQIRVTGAHTLEEEEM